MKLFQLAFSLHSLSVTFVTFTCFLSLSNCVTALAANSVSPKDLISGCDYILSNKQLRCSSEEFSLTVCVLLGS